MKYFYEYVDATRVTERTDLGARQYLTDIPATLDPPNDATRKRIGTDNADLKQWDGPLLRFLAFEDLTMTDVVSTIKTGTEIARTEQATDPTRLDVVTTRFEIGWDPVTGVAFQVTTVTNTIEIVGAMPPPPLP